MIFSNSKKFIFIAVPKTGKHAIREVLRPYLQKTDWEQQMRFGRDIAPIAELAAINHGHISYKQLSNVISRKELDLFFIFAFTRHPYDRFVSACAFLAREDPDYQNNPTSWMRRALGRERFRNRILVATQWSLLADRAGNLSINYIGKYESLQESFKDICLKVDIPTNELPRRNASKHPHYEDILDRSLKADIAEIYSDDFNAFNYDP
jgi:hypothetical protein